MLNDLRHALRLMTRQRGFTAIAVLTLALGIGTNTTIFALVNALLYRPLPAHETGRLRFVYLTDPGVPNHVSSLRYADYLDLQDRKDIFTGVLARSADQAQVAAGGDLRHARGEMVSGNYFDVLGVSPAVGRVLTVADDEAAAEPVAVISTGLWKARFDNNPSVLGSPIQLDDRAYTIVGVMPDWFRCTLGTWEQGQYWVPIRQRDIDWQCRRAAPIGDRPVTVIGRLQPGTTADEAQRALSTLRLPWTSLPAGAKPRDRLWSPSLFEAGRSSLPFDSFSGIVPERLAAGLMALASVVLLIAAANLAGMLAARGVSRQPEMATRIALGAGRWRITRQLLIESLLLSMAGGALGLLLSRWALSGFVAAVPSQFARFDLASRRAEQVISIDAPLDWSVLLYTLLLCLAAGVLVGIGPALRAGRSRSVGTLTSTAVTTGRRSVRSLRHLIIVPQICLSLGLLLLAGVLVSSLTRLELMDHGYDAAPLVSVAFELPRLRPCERSQPSVAELRSAADFRRQAYERMLIDGNTVPGVTSLSLAYSLPLEMPRAGGRWVSSRDAAGALSRSTYISRSEVSANYFETLGIPLLDGRAFGTHDAANGADVAVVSARLAQALWQDRNAIGQQVTFQEASSTDPPRWFEVIGVVGDVDSPLNGSSYARPAAYVPLGPNGYARWVVARGSLAAPQLIRELKLMIAKVAPGSQVGDGQRVDDAIASYLYPRRIAAGILSVAGIVGVLLASVGIYGVVSYSVAQRTRELGVRRALGADGRDIVGLILKEGSRVAALGAAFGLLFGYAVVRFTSSRLIALPSFDAATLIVAPALLAAVVLIACYIPARRASRIDPMTALRDL